jgi:hypothetical protein
MKTKEKKRKLTFKEELRILLSPSEFARWERVRERRKHSK